MYLRLEGKEENEFDVKCHVKSSLLYYSSALQYLQNKCNFIKNLLMRFDNYTSSHC